MRNKVILIAFSLFTIITLLNSCRNENAPTSNIEPNPEVLNLMVTNCYSCHNPKNNMDKRIAPPMIAVKRHYMSSGITKEQFVNDITAFLDNPSKDISKMPGAVKKFGVMPNMSFPKEQVEQIAGYMYDYEIESPKWFEKHYNEEHPKGIDNQLPYEKGNYKEMGMHFALTTKTQLGKNLMNVIKTKGTKNAVSFCNTQAYPLTDSMASVHQVEIKRVSDKPRNPKNKANETELAHISTFKTQLKNGEEIKPIVKEKSGMVYFYAPIKTNEMCMKCHGTPEDEVLKEILSLYPNDKATGYTPNQVRGIWSIKMKSVEK